MFRSIVVFIASLLGASVFANEGTAQPVPDTIVVNIKLSDDAFGASGEMFDLYPLEDALEEAMADTASLDGHEIGGGYFACLFQTDNVEDALQKASKILASHEFRPQSYVAIIYSDGRTKRINLPLAGH
ncbi:MAG: hypothetical protein NBV76_01060 [Candidatus Ochrobactrum gambitense]|nr:MAG: hypothetical protein NBV76_01060 [Candidatus Ochrobactrum gambitense]WEK15803.1 MAG: hypothetical protein P0Y54_09900 [Candidatus Ochrobactrum gambitense]